MANTVIGVDVDELRISICEVRKRKNRMTTSTLAGDLSSLTKESPNCTSHLHLVADSCFAHTLAGVAVRLVQLSANIWL